jgi:diaminopimelate decarboxylase
MKKIAGNDYLKKEKEKILIDSIPLSNFLKESTTPLMIFLENKIRDNINTFKDVFKSVFNNFQCFYSFKANYLLEICEIVHSEQIGAEVVGLPELNLALKIGFPPSMILVGGPYLPKELIETSVVNHVKEIVVYNLKDLEKINSSALRAGITQDICLRVNSQKYGSRLGVVFNETNLTRLGMVLKKCHNININSLLSHFSTQMNSIDQFKKNIQAIAKNVNKLKNMGIIIKNINLGGGFPEATVMPQEQLKKIAQEMKKIIEETGIEHEQIYFEPGRYFVGDAGLFLAEVINICEDRWTFLNVGNHICPRFARCSLRFYNASQINNPHKFKTSFAGIVPTDQDVLAKDYFFTEIINEGDIVLISNVGAYTLTFSNRFPYSLPKIFLVKDNEMRQIFDQYTDKDFSIC